jgi:DtxR family Mn-dependent transcriptional regulator
LEDYLEAILDLSETARVVRVTDIAARLNIAKPSVAQALSNLKKLKLITQDRYGPVWLTEEGWAYAGQVRQRHDILIRFLVEVLGVDADVAEKDACAMEHVVSAHTMERLVAFMRSQGHLPVGDAPPSGRNKGSRKP